MTSREKLLCALQHASFDRVPIDFGATSVTGMHVNTVIDLRAHYGLEKRPVKIFEPFQMLGLIEDDLQEAIGVDVEGVRSSKTIFGFSNENWKPWIMDNGRQVLVPGDFNTTKDEYGNTYIYPQGDTGVSPSGRMPKDGYYFDAIIRQNPIHEESLDPNDNLEEFTSISDQDLENVTQEIKRAAKTGRGVLVSFGGTALGDIAKVPAPFLKHPKGIRDVEEWYISTLTRPDYIHAVFEKQIDIALDNLRRLNQKAGEYIDVLYICGTDFGTQNSTFCSPDTFKDLYSPYYKKVNEWVHRNTNWKTFKHSCGAIKALIPLMIEAGFDILNPIQSSAVGMEPHELIKQFGNQLVFWGGCVDTQKTLPFGTPEQVRDQVLHRCDIFSKKGGYVCNAIHNIQANTPVDNVVAMIDAVHEYNGKR